MACMGVASGTWRVAKWSYVLMLPYRRSSRSASVASIDSPATGCVCLGQAAGLIWGV